MRHSWAQWEELATAINDRGEAAFWDVLRERDEEAKARGDLPTAEDPIRIRTFGLDFDLDADSIREVVAFFRRNVCMEREVLAKRRKR